MSTFKRPSKRFRRKIGHLVRKGRLPAQVYKMVWLRDGLCIVSSQNATVMMGCIR